MTAPADDWNTAAWQHVRSAPRGLPELRATLQMTRAACTAGMALDDRRAYFDPAAGWAYSDGVLAGLEMATEPVASPALDLPQPETAADVAETVDALLRHAADLCLDLGGKLQSDGDLPTLRTVAAVARQLPLTYEATFGRKW